MIRDMCTRVICSLHTARNDMSETCVMLKYGVVCVRISEYFRIFNASKENAMKARNLLVQYVSFREKASIIFYQFTRKKP